MYAAVKTSFGEYRDLKRLTFFFFPIFVNTENMNCV